MSHDSSQPPSPIRGGQYNRRPTDKLTELGQFVETMLPGKTRREQSEILGVREDVVSDMFMGGRTPSQRWVLAQGWEGILSKTLEWQKDNEGNTIKFGEIVGRLPLQSPYEIEPAKPDTLGEVFELAQLGSDRLEQARALGLLEGMSEEKAVAFVRAVATEDFPIKQQSMALHQFRIMLERHCLQHGGEQGPERWARVRDKYDAVAGQRVIDTVTGGSKEVLRAWSACVGEVFRRARELSTFEVDDFAQLMDEQPYIYGHIEQGGWLTHKNDLHSDKRPFRNVDLARTREDSLRIAEKIYRDLVGPPDPEKIRLMARLENLFPEVATAPYARNRAPLPVDPR